MIDKPSCLACGERGRPAFYNTRDYMCGTPGRYDYWKCPSCRLLWVSPQPTPEELRHLYEQNYGEVQHRPDLSTQPGPVKQAFRSCASKPLS